MLKFGKRKNKLVFETHFVDVRKAKFKFKFEDGKEMFHDILGEISQSFSHGYDGFLYATEPTVEQFVVEPIEEIATRYLNALGSLVVKRCRLETKYKNNLYVHIGNLVSIELIEVEPHIQNVNIAKIIPID